ncbi:MAG TPA: ECF transporter S component [Acholeplasmataceae bacterium]|nr:ECF transporter S component [Acholeplasmataceae bacterium]
MKRNNQVYELALTAIIGAIILFLSLIPNIGFIRILPGVSVTIVHIPVILGVFLLGLKGSIILGFFFGFGSFLAALIYASTPFDLAFINPLVSILPRMLFALVAYYIAFGFKKLANLKFGKMIMFGIVSLISAIGLFFGINQMTKQYTYNNYNVKNSELYQAIADGKDEEEIEALEIEVASLLNNANKKYDNARKITIPISIVLIIGLIVLYYIYTVRKNHQYTYLPSVFILSTLAHTVLVIAAVVIVNPKVFYETFGDSENVITIIYMIAAANGILEAFIGALIGSPITTTALVKQTEE